MEKISGIYSIVHNESGKIYIGSAINLYKREHEHRFDLDTNCHDNQRLQNAWNKYGKDAFKFEVLEIVQDPSNLLIKEQWWMDKLQSYDRNKGFNIRKIAESNFGLKHSPETIEKMSQSHLGLNKDKVGEKNHFFGKKHNDDSLSKMRTPRSDDFREIMKKAAAKRWEGHSIIKNCLNCELDFVTILCKDRDFCSKPCSSKYYGRLKTQEGTLKKNCLICSTEFVTNKFQDKKYCSRKCWAVSMKGNKNHSK